MNFNPLDMKGENNIRAKLSREDVIIIRERYASGMFTQKRIAIDYGINQASVNRIVRFRTWSHVK